MKRVYYDPILGIVNPQGWTPGGLLRIYACGAGLAVALWLGIWLLV